MKHHMKPLSAILLVIALFCTACTSRQTPSPYERNTIVATNFALFDLARQAYPGSCVMLISPGTESHDFECTFTDIAILSHAALVLYGGGEGDKWMDDVLMRIAEAGDPVPYLRAMDVIAGESEILREAESLESDGHNHNHDTHDHEHDKNEVHDDEIMDHSAYLSAQDAVVHQNSAVYLRTAPPHTQYDGYDEHVWTDPANGILLLHAIRDALTELALPVNDTTAYEARLIAADEGFRALAENGQITHLLFADRFPFLYFAHAYGFGYTAAFAGCSSDTEPSLSTLYHLLQEMDTLAPEAIYVIEFSDARTAHFLCEAHPCAIRELSSAHNVTQAEFDAGVTYASLLEKNLAVLSAP